MKRSRPKSKAIQPSQRRAMADFHEVVTLIREARARAFQSINTELISLYWRVGEHISLKIENAEWGEGVVDQLAAHISREFGNLKGFNRRNLFRMRQFYEAYRGEKKVSALLTQLSWTHHLLILSGTKTPEEREFYLRLSQRERWPSRELERQIRGALFKRALINPPKVSAALTQLHPAGPEQFKDAYLVDFIGLPEGHSEADLHHGLVANLRNFLTELGRDFCYVGTEYPLQVGNKDYYLDLLFFNRALNCLVVIELKIGEFKPEYLGKLEFYLEALDRDVRKPHEKPSIGVLLCATKDKEVVEYALSRSQSPALIAEYQTKLPEKKLLQRKLHEYYLLAEPGKFEVKGSNAKIKIEKKKKSNDKR